MNSRTFAKLIGDRDISINRSPSVLMLIILFGYLSLITGCVAQTPQAQATGSHQIENQLCPRLSLSESRLLTVQGNISLLWDLNTGNILRRFEGHSGTIESAALSPDGRQVITAATTGGELFLCESVRLWNALDGREVRRCDAGKTGVTRVQFIPNGKQVVSVSADGVMVLDSKSGKTTLRIPLSSRNSPANLHAIDVSADSRRIAVLEDGGRTATIYDIYSGRAFTPIRNQEGYFTSVNFSPDGKSMLTGNSAGVAETWDVTTGSRIRAFREHEGIVYPALYASAGRTIITASQDGTAICWDASSGNKIKKLIIAEEAGINEMALSEDGSRMIAKWNMREKSNGSAHECASLWNVESGREMLRLTNQLGDISGFSPQTLSFVIVNDGRPVSLWDGRTGAAIRKYETEKK